jgi:hypothetical protein
MMASQEQLGIIAAVKEGKNVIVDAVAGSGKTTTVLGIAKECQNKQVLQITYNSALKYEVQEKVKQQGISNLEVQNYHGLACKYYNRRAYTDGVFSKVVLEDKPLLRPINLCDILVIDEAQDMTPMLYRFVRKLIKDAGYKPQLVILGDKFQAIYGFKNADERFLTLADKLWRDYDFVHLNLHTSYRVTKHIASFVNQVMIGDNRIVADKEGVPVKYIILNPFEQIHYIATIITDLIKKGAEFHDFFILVGSVRSKQAPFKHLENMLVCKGFPCFVAKSDDTKIKEDDIRGKICFSTFHQSKGRERKNVIILGFDESYFEFYGKDYNRNICPNTLYVAVTRASEQLIVTESKTFFPLTFAELPPRAPYIDYINLTKKRPQPIKSSPEHTSSVVDLVRHLGENTISILNPIIDILFQHTHKSNSSVILTNKITNDDCLVEDVSHLNGLAIPTIREARHNEGKTKMYHYISHNYERIVDTHPYIYKEILKIKKECKKVRHYLFMSNVYVAMREELYHKLAQVHRYDWLSWEQVNQCIDIMDAHVPTDHIKYEVELGNKHTLTGKCFRYRSPVHGNINIYGIVDAVDDETVWEFKCTDSTVIDHFLQVIMYAWIWRHCVEGKRKFKLMNVMTGDIFELDTHSHLIDEVVNVILDKKYGKKIVLSDEEFIDYCSI